MEVYQAATLMGIGPVVPLSEHKLAKPRFLLAECRIRRWILLLRHFFYQSSTSLIDVSLRRTSNLRHFSQSRLS